MQNIISGRCVEDIDSPCCVLVYDESNGSAYAPDCTAEGKFSIPGRYVAISEFTSDTNIII